MQPWCDGSARATLIERNSWRGAWRGPSAIAFVTCLEHAPRARRSSGSSAALIELNDFRRRAPRLQGFGPQLKGTTMKTDADLKKDVIAELTWDPAVRATAIGVAVKDGVVTLTGHLETFAEKYAASRALKRVAGVKAIALELDVRLAPNHQRSDTDIAASAEQALKWNTTVPTEAVRLTVDHGWVTLQGELEWDYQRRSVEKAIRPLVGVVGISNEITLRTRPQAVDLARRIEEALTRQAIREAKQIQIAVEGNTVKLTGKVHSWHERDAAQGVAWSAPGVRTVVNELRVG
jgi:osmotically-inducible protein OsmY